MSVDFWVLPLFHHISVNFGRSSSKMRRKPKPVSYKLMSVTDFFSNDFFHFFIILVIRVFSFSFIFVHICIFNEFILFPCRIIILLTRQFNGRHCRKNAKSCKKAESGYVNCFCWIVYAFWVETQLSRNTLWVVFGFCLCLSSFPLLCAIYPMAIDLNCFPKTYNST